LGSTQALLKTAKTKKKANRRKAIDKQEAFLEFKQEEEGRQLEESIRDNRAELKAIKVTVKELTEQCNNAKRKLDKVKAELDKKQDERREGMQNALADEEEFDGDDGPQEIIDEDELALL
jgi:septal ring factor EnvC (AmiA/AmiB activator)